MIESEENLQKNVADFVSSLHRHYSSRKKNKSTKDGSELRKIDKDFIDLKISLTLFLDQQQIVLEKMVSIMRELTKPSYNKQTRQFQHGAAVLKVLLDDLEKLGVRPIPMHDPDNTFIN